MAFLHYHKVFGNFDVLTQFLVPNATAPHQKFGDSKQFSSETTQTQDHVSTMRTHSEWRIREVENEQIVMYQKC